MNWINILTIIFVIAKITGYVTFSWWLVFLPSIISFGLGVLIVAVGFTIAFIKA